MIDDPHNRVHDGIAIQIVPFAIVPPKLAAVSVASVNPNDATWRALNLHSTAIPKLYPCDSSEIPCDEADAQQPVVLNGVQDNSLPYTCPLQLDSLGDINTGCPRERSSRNRYRIPILGQCVVDGLYVC